MLFRNEILYIDNAIGLGYNKYNGQKYVYRKNLQGDIVAILDECGCTRGTYEYDAWGKIIWQGGSELLTINPFRYRGDYYDEETGLYYLNSRYYDPETGRFISPDSLKYLEPETCNGLNLYAYCGNNPINYIDPTGCFPFAILLILAITTSIGLGVGGMVAYQEGLTGWEAAGAVLLGGALGLAVGGLIVATTGAAVGVIKGINAALWGLKAKQVFAIGVAIYDIVAVTAGPLAGLSMELVEWGMDSYQPDSPTERPKHPATQNHKSRVMPWGQPNDRILWKLF